MLKVYMTSVEQKEDEEPRTCNLACVIMVSAAFTG